MSYETFISLRYLRAKQRGGFISLITWLSVGGVALGVAALIIVMAVMSGFKEGWRDKILGTSPHVTIYTYDPGGMEGYRQVTALVRALEGVKSAGPFIEKQALLSSEARDSGAIIKGVELGSLKDTLGAQVIAGNIDLMNSPKGEEASGEQAERIGGGLLLGAELANSLNVKPGDELTLISPTGTATPMGMVPRMKKFRVAGIFQTGTGYDAALAYIALDKAQAFFGMKRRADGIEVWVKDIFKADRMGRSIMDKLGFPYWTRDWKQANKALFAALRWEKIAMFIILALMVLVAAFSIVSMLMMMVMEKGKEIAILKSIGATRRGIMKIFTLQGMVIGALGTAIGAAAGFTVGKVQQTYHVIKLDSGVYGLDILPINIEYWWGFAFICIVAMALCYAATLYPSRKAAGIDPTVALRYE